MLSKNSRLIRRYITTTILIVGSLPLLAYGAIHAIEGMCVAPEKWAPPTFEARRTYDKFASQFETGDVVVVSWDGCTIDDPRLAKLATLLRDEEGLLDFAHIIDRVVTGRSVVEELTAAPLSLPHDEAINRLVGTLIGPDRTTSCAVIVLTPEGNDQRRDSITRILDFAESDCRVPAESMHVVGPPVNGVAIDDASIKGINVFGNLSLAISVVLCWFYLRSWFYTLTIIGTGVFGQAFSLAAVYFAGYQLDAILIIIPSLVLVLTVSAGVHLANYYRDEVHAAGVEGAAARALTKALKPCLLSAATTAVGIGSLLASQITPVMMFGAIASLGVLVSVGALLLVLPGAMELRPMRGEHRSKGSPSQGLLTRVTTYPNLITGIGVSAIVVAMSGLPRLTTSVDVVSLFSKQSVLVNDYEWFENNIGKSVPIEIVVSMKGDSGQSTLQKLRLVHSIQNRIDESSGFSGTMSAATLAPDFDVDGSVQQRLLRSAILNRRLSQSQQRYKDAHFLAATENEELWRISARTTALDRPDYAASLQQLKNELADFVAIEFPDDDIKLSYTGMMPLASTVQQAVLDDLRNSFLTAVAVIAVVMMLTLRSFKAGLLSMLPNVFPVVIVFGILGLSNIAIDIGMIMTASVALGIAIDDTLHFLTWYRRELAEGSSSSSAVARSIRHCGRAMTQTTLICGLGLSAFLMSDFAPTQQFSLMMCILLLSALAADLVFLPAIILSPIGRCFASNQTETACESAAMLPFDAASSHQG